MFINTPCVLVESAEHHFKDKSEKSLIFFIGFSVWVVIEV